uniref:F-box domain-containing protein n=1 Tax=Oryza punctata TaxID=4537 RepID=A0A0E0KH78_ORYPU
MKPRKPSSATTRDQINQAADHRCADLDHRREPLEIKGTEQPGQADMAAALPDDVLAERPGGSPRPAASARVGATSSTSAACCAPDLLPLSLGGIFVDFYILDFPMFLGRHPTGTAVSGNFDFLPMTDEFSCFQVRDHCNGLVLLDCDDFHCVVNPATRWWSRLHPRPPSLGSPACLVFDPAVSPHHEVFLIPSIGCERRPGVGPSDLKSDHAVEWPSSPYAVSVFSSRTGQWEERRFLREGEPADFVSDAWINGRCSPTAERAVYWRGALYVMFLHTDFVVRFSLVDDKYQVIKPPMMRTGWNGYKYHIVWILDESCSQMKWQLKHEKDLKDVLHQVKNHRHAWNLQDINYRKGQSDYYTRGAFVKKYVEYGTMTSEEKSEWNSDSDDDVEREDIVIETFRTYIGILGFHPYKEIIFLGEMERQEDTATTALPDDILAEVLRRLSPRDVAASRCVCKPWRDLVDERRLLRADLLPRSFAGVFINFWDIMNSEFFARPSSTGTAAIFGHLDFMPFTLRWHQVKDHCNGLLLLDYGCVVNPATRWWARFPPQPPWPEMGSYHPAYLVFDPAVSPQYEVFLIPDRPRTPGWPPSVCVLCVFSSETERWEKRTFVREREDAGGIRSNREGIQKRNAVYWRGALYVHCNTDFIMRISVRDDRYRVIEFPKVTRMDSYENGEFYLGRSEKGVYLALVRNCCWLQVWILDESCGEIKWELKHDKDIKYSLLGRNIRQGLGPWIVTDINYHVNRKKKAQREKVEYEPNMNVTLEKFEWSSDDDNILDNQDIPGIYNEHIIIIGFHPFKEIIFLSESLKRGLAYHLNSSKVEDLGNLSNYDYVSDYYWPLIRGLATSHCVCNPWSDLVGERRLLHMDLLPHSLAGIFINFSGLFYPEFFARPSTGATAISGLLDFSCPPTSDATMSRIMQRPNFNPATRWWARLPPRPPPREDMEMNYIHTAYLVFDPAASPHYEVCIQVELEPSEWPPSLYVLPVFLSRTERWEERTFVREEEAARTSIVPDMRISLRNDKYQVIKVLPKVTRMPSDEYLDYYFHISWKITNGSKLEYELNMEATLEKYAWSSDDDNAPYNEDIIGRHHEAIDIIGFHPFKEIIFFGELFERVLAYHLNGSKIED